MHVGQPTPRHINCTFLVHSNKSLMFQSERESMKTLFYKNYYLGSVKTEQLVTGKLRMNDNNKLKTKRFLIYKASFIYTYVKCVWMSKKLCLKHQIPGDRERIWCFSLFCLLTTGHRQDNWSAPKIVQISFYLSISSLFVSFITNILPLSPPQK